MSIFPPDAAEKIEASAKDRKYYENLTDEEREEEGIPPEEKQAPPEIEAPETADEPEPERGEEEETPISTLVDQIAGLREDLTSALGKPEEAPKGEEDPLIAAARDHDDPVVQGLAERLERAEQELAAHREEARAQRTERQQARDDADFAAVQQAYLIAGQPMTDAQVEAVEDYILKNPDIGSRLSIAELTRIVHPDAVKAPVADRKPKGKVPKDDGEVATIVEEGNTGGVSDEKWRPKPNEDMASAVQAAGRRFGWVR